MRKRIKRLLAWSLVFSTLMAYSGNEVAAAGLDGQLVGASQETESKEQSTDAKEQEAEAEVDGTEETDAEMEENAYTDTLDSLYSENLPTEIVEEIAENLESDYSKVGQPSISALLEEYRALRDQVYLGETLSESVTIAPEILSFEADRSDRIQRMEQESGISFTKADTTFQVQDQQTSGDETILTVYEWVFLTYNNGADISGYGFDHVMTVTKKETGYYLSSDSYADGSLAFVASPGCTDRQQQEAGLALGDTSVLEDTTGEVTEESEGSVAYGAGKYSPDSAVAYSDTYATSYNSNYSNYNSVGGDCANFVSQCLAAGGLSQTSGWYYNSYNNRSSSWIYCPTQRTYMATQGTLIDNPSTSQIKRGNPIWYYKNGTYAHAAICVGTNSSGTPIINAHNTDRYHAIWNLGGAASGWTGYSTVQIQAQAQAQVHNPTAFLDEAKGDTKSVYVQGWAFDADAPSKALAIHVYVGGPAGSGAPGYEIYADKSRPDVGRAYPGMGDDHGFEATIAVSKTGTQPIYVYAINEGGGTNVLIDTKTVTIKAQSSTSSKVTEIALNKSTLIFDLRGESEKLTAAILPKNAANQKVTWFSGNPEAATVDTEGTVTAVSKGMTIITAITEDGRKLASCAVVVEQEASDHAHACELVSQNIPDCTNTGSITYQCSECEAQCTESLPALGHAYGFWEITREPTYEAEGSKVSTCTYCGKQRTKTIAKLERTDLSEAVFTGVENKNYTGEAVSQPGLLVTLGENTLTKNKDYTITYKNNIKIGVASIVIEGIGDYKGTAEKFFRVIVVRGKTYQVGDQKYKMIYTKSDGNGSVMLTGTTKSRNSVTSLSVPKTVNIGGKHYKVTAIQRNAFKSYGKLTRLSIGSNVTIIGSSAFAGCTNLSSVTIGTGLVKLGFKTFYNCRRLKKLTIQSTRLASVGLYSITNIAKTATLQVPNSKRASYRQKFHAKTGFKDTMKLY